jgi:hypothetical protein
VNHSAVISSRRYPLAPLMAATGIQSMKQLRDIFPMNGTTYRQVMDEGLATDQADRWAVRLGLHPWQVWPDWSHIECAATDCDATFIPKQAHQRFCGSTCSSRQRRRDRYDRDPEYREKRREEARRYYETCGDYVRRRNRERKQARREAA